MAVETAFDDDDLVNVTGAETMDLYDPSMDLVGWILILPPNNPLRQDCFRAWKAYVQETKGREFFLQDLSSPEQDCFRACDESNILREFLMHVGNTREDFSMPVILVCHHVGRPVYRLVLDVFQIQGHPQLQVRMWSNWHGRYHATPYHGSWRMLNNFTLVIVLRWFATQANEGQIKLCFITLRPLEC